MTTTQELEAQLVPLKPQVVLIGQTLAAIRERGPVPADCMGAARVLQGAGHIRWSSRAKRYMLTDSGSKFYRQMRKFGHA